MLLLLALLFQDDPLRYKFEKDSSRNVSVDLALGLKLTGTSATIDFFRSLSPFFSFERIRLRGDGRRSVLGLERLRLQYLEARVDGRYDDQDYEYDFTSDRPPGDLDKDKLKQMLWYIFAGGKTFRLTGEGALETEDKDQDATGEVLDHFALAAVRLPENRAAKWESKFATKRVQKDNGGRFEIVQKSRLEKFSEGRAHIVSDVSGTLVLPKDAKKDPNQIKAEHTVEGKIRMVLDAARGEVISSESAGKVRFYYKGTDPNGGDDHEIEVVLTVESSVSPRR